MKKILSGNALKILIAGMLYGLSFPPINFHFLVFFSFIIVMDQAMNSKSFKQVLFRSYMIFFTACLLGVSWISLSGLRDNADTFLIFAGIFVMIVYPLFFVPAFLLLFFAKKNLAQSRFKLIVIFIFPLLWTGFEYLSSLGQINFPWLYAGNTQTHNLSKIQFAEYTGMFGVSFWICMISTSIYFSYKKITAGEWKVLSASTISMLVIVLALYFFPDIYDSVRTKSYTESAKVKLGIIQPNVNPWKKWSGKQDDLVGSYITQIKELNSANPGLKMIILPETALPYYFRERHFEERYRKIQDVCDSLNVPFLIGTPDLEYYKDQSLAPPDAKIMKSSGLKYDTYNTAVLFQPYLDKDELQKHYKVKLVIGSERMPYQEYFPFINNFVEWGVGIGNWQIGYDTNNFVIDDKYKFNTAICYESVYPEFFSEFVKRGAEFSVIITNDGWWGKFFGTYQHNRFAVFRAIENRRWIARCANTGISDFIDPEGNMYDETKIDEKTSIVKDVGIIKEKTFYTMHGDLFSRICLYAGVLLAAVTFTVRKKSSP